MEIVSNSGNFEVQIKKQYKVTLSPYCQEPPAMLVPNLAHSRLVRQTIQEVKMLKVFGALIIAKLLSVPRYTFSWLVQPMWWVIKFLHRAADLTLVPLVSIGKDLEEASAAAANQIRLWNKGVDSVSFHPRYKSHEMRLRLREELEKMFEGMPTVFTGMLGGEELSQAYASGDVFVMAMCQGVL